MPPSAAAMRRRVIVAIERHREAVDHMSRNGRDDIGRLMQTPGSGWDSSLWDIGCEWRLYRAIWRAECAHARGEELDRWAIFA